MDAAQEPPVFIHVEPNRRQAWSLAQLLKRIGWSDCRALAVDEDETQLMISATDRVSAALRDAGFVPR